MTWNEFKTEIDLRLEEAGISPNIKISWIDWAPSYGAPEIIAGDTSIAIEGEGDN